MKIFKTMFLSTLAVVLALFLVGQMLVAYQQNRSMVSKVADKVIDAGTESYEAVASLLKGQM
jgi:hypothetical protein